MALVADEPFVLTGSMQKEIDHWVAKFPVEQKQSAVLSALNAVQDEHGWLPRNALDAVADYLEMPAIAVYEVATFYTMYHLMPVGRNVIYFCTNISCMLCGAEKIEGYLKKKLGVGFNETTPDGQFTLKEVECLGACVGAPVMQVNRDYYENVTAEVIDEVITKLTQNKTNVGSTGL